MSEIVLKARFRVLDKKKLMSSAEELGRIHGRDNDWSPETLEEAIEELELLGEGCPVNNGYEVASREFSRV